MGTFKPCPRYRSFKVKPTKQVFCNLGPVVAGKMLTPLKMNGWNIPSRGLTYPTLGEGKSSSKCHFGGIC